MHERRAARLLTGVLLASVPFLPGPARGQEKPPSRQPGLVWHDVAGWSLEGRGFADTASPFDRLPSRAEALVRAEVWRLSRQSAGLMARFETDARRISVRYRLRFPELSLPHMPATGVSGVDLYARDARGSWRWLAGSRPTSQEVTSTLVEGIDPGRRAYALYFPLYNGVTALELGIPEGSVLSPLPRRERRPLVLYGTSILQGACASRPGMAWAAILGRRLDVPVLNFGFSGNGLMEPEVVALLAEIDAALYVIDCLPNMRAPEVEARTGPLVHALRESRPRTPIVLMEDRSFSNAAFLEARRRHHAASRAALRRAFSKLEEQGVKGLHYVAGADLLGGDGEAATDGSHPSDLGMVRYADALEVVLRPLLGG